MPSMLAENAQSEKDALNILGVFIFAFSYADMNHVCSSFEATALIHLVRSPDLPPSSTPHFCLTAELIAAE